MGVTASSVSAEGVSLAADWSEWERDGRAPRSGDGAGLGIDWHDDLDQLARIGCSDWRITIEWARIEPEPHRVNHDVIDRYHDILAYARSLGIANWLTLQHGSLPGWYLDDEGGHGDASARERYWLRHVDRVAEAFEDVADGFVPIEDPISWAIRGYGLGSRPPGLQNPSAMGESVYGAVLAVHDAVRLLSSGSQSLMTTWRAEPVHAVPDEDGRFSIGARKAAREWDNLLWGTWLRCHANGVLEVDGRYPVEVPLLVSAVDHVGLVHDHPVGVTEAGTLAAWPVNATTAGTGFAPEPDELAEAIHRTHDALPDHSLMVAAHGVATSDEAWRDHLLARSLDHISEAAHDIGLAGYFHDSGFDGYEWKLGFSHPRGLIGRDRVPKPASETFAQFNPHHDS